MTDKHKILLMTSLFFKNFLKLLKLSVNKTLNFKVNAKQLKSLIFSDWMMCFSSTEKKKNFFAPTKVS